MALSIPLLLVTTWRIVLIAAMTFAGGRQPLEAA